MNTETQIAEKTTSTRNPIEMPSIASVEIVDSLDELLSSFSIQFHNYLKHHWLVEGPLHRDLHQFFDDAYNSTLQQLDAIAERITVLGGTPSSSPRTYAAKSFIEIEGDQEMPLRKMVENDLRNEQTLISRLRESIRLASKLGDYGTETLLKQTLAKREDQAHELDHYLVHEKIDPAGQAS